MTGNTDDEEYQRSMTLMRVIEKQPKLFQKWCEIKDKFSTLGLYDSPFKESTFTIHDALALINKEFEDDDRQPARI